MPSCPLCSLALSPGLLTAHLREELRYPSLACLLCRLTFTSAGDAEEHFAEEHRGRPPQLLRLTKDQRKEARLEELVRLAEGGEVEVEKRLCVCGQCRLLCREDFRVTSGQVGSGAGNDAAPREAVERQEGYLDQRQDAEVRRMSSQPFQVNKEEDTHQQTINRQETTKESEEEPQTPMDIKPDLSELKPKVNVDGKVACIQCGMRVDKAWFKQHAIGAHSSARPFSCNLCPHNEKTKGALAKHQMKDHEAELSEETFTYAGSEGNIREIVEQCFGSTNDTDWARLRCKPCDKLVNKKELKNHAATDHLKKPLHSCKLCDHRGFRFAANNMNLHVKRVHKRQPGPDTIDSSQAQHYDLILKNMIPQLFSNP